MRKKGRVAVIFLCMVLWMTGCSEKTGDDRGVLPRSIRIGICVYDQFDTFIASLVEDFHAAAKQKEKETGITMIVEVAGAGGKQNVQNDQVDDFIEKGCDIICVNLVDRTDSSMVIDKAKNADVPVIFFNREPVQEDLKRWDKLYYVGTEVLKSGIMQGEIVTGMCSGPEGIAPYDQNGDGKLQYVMLEGEVGHQDALIRTEYAVKTISDAGIPLEKMGNAIANWKRAQAQTKMDQWLSEYGSRIEMVLSNNDEMALGAIDACEKYGMLKLPIVMGIDGTDEALQAIKEGRLSGTVVNDAKGQARAMLELAYALRCDTSLPEDIVLEDSSYIRLPHKIVTAGNVDEAIQAK